MVTLADLLDGSEILNVPVKMKPFLYRSRDSDEMQSWGAYAYGFSAAFDELYQIAAQTYPRSDHLLPPIAYLARHSIELCLKDAILSLSVHSSLPTGDHGHQLLALWNELIQHIQHCGFGAADGWTKHCAKIVRHLDDSDRGSMRFRYPADKSGSYYDPTRIELDGLGKSHHHLTRYCDAVVSMINAAQP